jgi:hypothetical protein
MDVAGVLKKEALASKITNPACAANTMMRIVYRE